MNSEKGKRIVIALGGNALGNNLPEQMKAVRITAKAMVDLIEDGNEVVICHGNGLQVGMIQNVMAELTRSDPGERSGLFPGRTFFETDKRGTPKCFSSTFATEIRPTTPTR